MTTEPNDSLIRKLSVELLWKIFWENTDMLETGQDARYEIEENQESEEGVKPLNSLRRTAQVCYLWREIIVGPGSAALWGRVIDLDLLQWRSRVDWRKEVIKRAGQARLHIFGTIRIDLEESRVFLGELLDEHWSTIEVFVVSVAGPSTFSGIKPDLWLPLQRASPLLDTFKLIFGEQNFWRFKPLDHPLFSNDAPALRVFGLRETPKPQGQLFLLGSWLKHLRNLELMLNEPCFHLPAFLATLSDMPHLETLAIGNILFEPPSHQHTQKISLKFLTRFLIMALFRPTLSLIDNIVPSSTCSVTLSVGVPKLQRNIASADADIQTLRDALSRYTDGYIVEAHQRAESSFMALLPHMFIFVASRNYALDPKFFFRFDFQEVFPSALISALLAALLPAPELQRFGRLKTFLFSSDNVTLNDEQLDMLTGFFASLTSVTELTLGHGFKAIQVVQTRCPGIFPRLGKLRLQDMEGSGVVKDTVRLLSGRVDHGRTVKTLELPEHPPQILLDELELLDVFPGLRVVWGDNEYMCGSGTLEGRQNLNDG